jgi:hypothetical protein
MRKNLPREGQRVITPSGPGKVTGVNPLSETIMVQLDESQAIVELTVSDIKLESKPPELEVKDVITSEEPPPIDNVDN